MKTAEEWQSEFVTNPEWGTYANMPHFVRAIQLDAMKKKQ